MNMHKNAPGCSSPPPHSKHLNSLILSNPETSFFLAEISGFTPEKGVLLFIQWSPLFIADDEERFPLRCSCWSHNPLSWAQITSRSQSQTRQMTASDVASLMGWTRQAQWSAARLQTVLMAMTGPCQVRQEKFIGKQKTKVGLSSV